MRAHTHTYTIRNVGTEHNRGGGLSVGWLALWSWSIGWLTKPVHSRSEHTHTLQTLHNLCSYVRFKCNAHNPHTPAPSHRYLMPERARVAVYDLLEHACEPRWTALCYCVGQYMEYARTCVIVCGQISRTHSNSRVFFCVYACSRAVNWCEIVNKSIFSIEP